MTQPPDDSQQGTAGAKGYSGRGNRAGSLRTEGNGEQWHLQDVDCGDVMYPDYTS